MDQRISILLSVCLSQSLNSKLEGVANELDEARNRGEMFSNWEKLGWNEKEPRQIQTLARMSPDWRQSVETIKTLGFISCLPQRLGFKRVSAAGLTA